MQRTWRRTTFSCVIVCAVLVAGPATSGASRGGPSASERGLRVLQMNLCNSGLADCYTGHSVTEAAAVIRDQAPDLVTLNEVCRDDVAVLERAMAERDRGGAVASAFQPALDRRTGDAFRCRNGEPYGIGLVTRRSPSAGAITRSSGFYPVQDPGEPEERAWVCLGAAAFEACTTHLANSSAAVARAQCDYLLGTVIPAARAQGAPAPVVLGGDLNLRGDGSPDVRPCVPDGDRRTDDGGVQHVVVTADFTVTARQAIDMDATTDHPGLLVTLTPFPPTVDPRGPARV